MVDLLCWTVVRDLGKSPTRVSPPCNRAPCNQAPCNKAPCNWAPCNQAPCNQAPCNRAPCNQAPNLWLQRSQLTNFRPRVFFDRAWHGILIILQNIPALRVSSIETESPERPPTLREKVTRFLRRRREDTDTGDGKGSTRRGRTSQKKPKEVKKTKKARRGCSCWPFKRRQNSEEEWDDYTTNALGNIGLLLAGATMPEVADTHGIYLAARAAFKWNTVVWWQRFSKVHEKW